MIDWILSNPRTTILIGIVLVAALMYFNRGEIKPKRPKPQQPPSDRERFNAIKRDWQDKQ